MIADRGEDADGKDEGAAAVRKGRVRAGAGFCSRCGCVGSLGWEAQRGRVSRLERLWRANQRCALAVHSQQGRVKWIVGSQHGWLPDPGKPLTCQPGRTQEPLVFLGDIRNTKCPRP